jgi:hypothetical protein
VDRLVGAVRITDEDLKPRLDRVETVPDLGWKPGNLSGTGDEHG